LGKSCLAEDGEQHCVLPDQEVDETKNLEHLAVKAVVPQNEAAHRSEDPGGKDDASDSVVGEMSWNLNRNDHIELAQLTTILNIRGWNQVAVRH
jgi:hypothetical protein